MISGKAMALSTICARSFALIWVLRASRSATHVGSCSASNMTFSQTPGPHGRVQRRRASNAGGEADADLDRRQRPRGVSAQCHTTPWLILPVVFQSCHSEHVCHTLAQVSENDMPCTLDFPHGSGAGPFHGRSNSPELSVEERNSMSVVHGSIAGNRRAAWRIIASAEQKGKTKAYEQQAADAREYAIVLEAELQRIYAGILALMDENLIPSASTGEPKAFYSEKKDDYYRFLAERATGDAKRQAPMIQKVLKTVEAPQMQYSDRIPQRTAEQAVDAPVPQVTEEIIEMFNVLSQDRVQQRNVEQTTETPAVSLAEEIVEAPKAQTQEKRIHERIVEKPDVPVPRVTEKTIEVVKFSPQERVQNRTVRQIMDVPIPRVMEEILEVETLLADNKLSSKLAGSCTAQAPEWEQRQRVRAEELVTIHDTNQLLNDNDSLELLKETVPSPSLMQLQSDKRGVAPPSAYCG